MDLTAAYFGAMIGKNELKPDDSMASYAHAEAVAAELFQQWIYSEFNLGNPKFSDSHVCKTLDIFMDYSIVQTKPVSEPSIN